MHTIKAHLTAINSADDQVNPPELGLMEAAIGDVTNGKYVLLPIRVDTRGHGTLMTVPLKFSTSFLSPL